MDREQVFDEDYLYFYERYLTSERSDAEAELIWRLAELDAGAEVLDLACGHGRIANRLAARGARVTGLDATPLFLERARQAADDTGVAVEYVEGDMRELPWSERFDCVVLWFTAFGYFSDDENRRVLDEVNRALKPGGCFLLELNNLPAILRTFQHATLTERDDDFIVDRHRFDIADGRMQTERTVVRRGAVRRFSYEVRMFLFTELRDWLRAAGFASVDAFGGSGDAPTLDSRRLVIVARR